MTDDERLPSTPPAVLEVLREAEASLTDADPLGDEMRRLREALENEERPTVADVAQSVSVEHEVSAFDEVMTDTITPVLSHAPVAEHSTVTQWFEILNERVPNAAFVVREACQIIDDQDHI
ncbi:MAG: hypothetical protein ACLGIA_02260 [Actinomycetes bacterium]